MCWRVLALNVFENVSVSSACSKAGLARARQVGQIFPSCCFHGRLDA